MAATATGVVKTFAQVRVLKDRNENKKRKSISNFKHWLITSF